MCVCVWWGVCAGIFQCAFFFFVADHPRDGYIFRAWSYAEAIAEIDSAPHDPRFDTLMGEGYTGPGTPEENAKKERERQRRQEYEVLIVPDDGEIRDIDFVDKGVKNCCYLYL